MMTAAGQLRVLVAEVENLQGIVVRPMAHNESQVVAGVLCEPFLLGVVQAFRTLSNVDGNGAPRIVRDNVVKELDSRGYRVAGTVEPSP